MDEPVKRVASPGHTALVLGILAAFAAWGAYNAQRMRATGSQHHIALYLQTLGFEWAMVGIILWGVRREGGDTSVVLGERWNSAWEAFLDIRIAGLFWVASLIALNVLSHILHAGSRIEAVRFLMPHGAVELALWVVLAISAGICEEAIFRGYLQRQFLAYTGNVPAAIALSAVAFGIGHGYQGLVSAVIITCYGAMFGVLAQWRKSVRPGMMAHGWQDSIAGIAGSILEKSLPK